MKNRCAFAPPRKSGQSGLTPQYARGACDRCRPVRQGARGERPRHQQGWCRPWAGAFCPFCLPFTPGRANMGGGSRGAGVRGGFRGQITRGGRSDQWMRAPAGSGDRAARLPRASLRRAQTSNKFGARVVRGRMAVAWRLMAFLVFCLLAASAGGVVGLWTSRPTDTRLNSSFRVLCWVAYVLWCISWLPTVVGMLSETPGIPETPERTAIRAVCAANALLYYVGGGTWLAVRCRGSRGSLIALAWIFFCFLNTFGPATLVVAKTVLGMGFRQQHRQV